jgi:hypothetical protein
LISEKHLKLKTAAFRMGIDIICVTLLWIDSRFSCYADCLALLFAFVGGLILGFVRERRFTFSTDIIAHVDGFRDIYDLIGMNSRSSSFRHHYFRQHSQFFCFCCILSDAHVLAEQHCVFNLVATSGNSNKYEFGIYCPELSYLQPSRL